VSQDLNHIASQLKFFPSAPGAAVKLLALIDNPEINLSRIEKILRQDAGLTANFLKLANSAYFGIPAKVGSVRQAIVLLGLKRLIQMVIASCVSAIMEKPVPGYDFFEGELWRHSIAVTVAAEGLAKELNVETAEEISTAALLHDVGKFVLSYGVIDDYQKVESALSSGRAYDVAENRVTGTNHAFIGGLILDHWSLPADIVNAVRWHHDPDSAEQSDLMLDIVHVANVLCVMIGIGVGRSGLQHQPSAAVIERLGLSPGHLEKVANQTLQWVDGISQEFGNNYSN
jgi:putative nucleotidyltransferase with HDIG domain